jgi:DNA-binding NarL/FixJ family response regulator
LVSTSGFVGRRAELEQFGVALCVLDVGASVGVVQLAGEPGIGKSRLIAEVCGRAEQHNHLVLSGKAAEFEQELPFSVFAVALDDYLASLPPEQFESLSLQDLSQLGAVFPSLAPLAGRDSGLRQGRYETYRAVRAVLELLAAERPLVLALDDLHWADVSSEELLAHLLAHPPRAPILILVSFRQAQISARLEETLSAAVRDKISIRYDLAPLTRSEAAELIAGADNERLIDRLYRESGGNPFYLEQLSQSAGLEKAQAETSQSMVPPQVATAIAAELRSLPSTTRYLLAGAAVAGDPFDIGLAAIAADLEDDVALEALDQLLRRDVLRQTQIPRRFRFRHPIVWRSVYESTAMSVRLAAHERIATALTQRGAAAPTVAYHLEWSATMGDEAAIAVLSEAGDLSASRYPASAAHWYAAARRLLPGGPENQPQQLQLLMSEALALSAAGTLKKCHEILMEALDQIDRSHPFWLYLVASCASVESLLGRPITARKRLLAALDSLRADRVSEAAIINVELAAASCLLNDYDESCSRAREAMAVAAELELPIYAQAAAVLSYALFSLGDNSESERLLHEVAQLMDSLDEEGFAEHLPAVTWLSVIEAWTGRLDQSLRHVERGLAVSRSSGQGQLLVVLEIARTWGLILSGKLTTAAESLDRALVAAKASGSVKMVAIYQSLRGMSAIEAGDHAAAVKAGREAVELFRILDEEESKITASVFLGIALIDSGDTQAGKVMILFSAGGSELPKVHRPLKVRAYEALTRAEITMGDIGAAKGWVRRAFEVPGFGALAIERGTALRAQAAVMIAEGDSISAAQIALTAADLAARAGSPIDASRSRIVAGRAFSKSRDRDRAVAELQKAEEALARCGAAHLRNAVLKELRHLGVRRRTATKAEWGLGSLTEREIQIARLVAGGKTNKQIAAACFLSEKTVESHLSHAFRKLGVSSRSEVAALIPTMDAAGPGQA